MFAKFILKKDKFGVDSFQVDILAPVKRIDPMLLTCLITILMKNVVQINSSSEKF
jgi:hypothetical protein